MFLLVPNYVADAINCKLDAVLATAPPEAAKSREAFYQELLNHYNETGTIPDFEITKGAKP